MEEAVFFHKNKEMKENINKYEKLEDIKHEDMRELPDYMKEKGIEKSRKSKASMQQKICMKLADWFSKNLVQSKYLTLTLLFFSSRTAPICPVTLRKL